ncbi:basic helix-loop-helix (bHLH) DNA-bindingsuperfamily protein [Striga asiatica]|uniref:Basic helix-loop-helix (BHLH) DNA-bindingsuperfamily protein n=1 Tax=Striga asiatica TaxID=4170 RepID=A0A5A7PR88_STRAF|nr:basic helix-loop-helix (bHLH) DNA-bindingsuperfamily protein [Striga asiatica]
MFHLQSDGLSVEAIPSFYDWQQDKVLEDLLADDCAHFEGINECKNEGGVVKKRRRPAMKSMWDNDGDKDTNHETRRSIHRNLERQRRQEMAGLYASLRSLLPLEFIKGKRSVSDQLHQAANYIRFMQKKIEEMKIRRDKLKTLSANGRNKSVMNNTVKVILCKFGLEILIMSTCSQNSTEEHFLPLSKVYAYLLQKPELTVINCVSTRAGDECSSLHKIQVEVDDPTSVDLTALQTRLADVIN